MIRLTCWHERGQGNHFQVTLHDTELLSLCSHRRAESVGAHCWVKRLQEGGGCGVPTTWLDVTDVRRRWRGFPDTTAVLIEALGRGWRLSDQGHGGRLFCAVEHDPDHRHHQITVSGTPANDGRHARRLARELRVCDSCQPTEQR